MATILAVLAPGTTAGAHRKVQLKKFWSWWSAAEGEFTKLGDFEAEFRGRINPWARALTFWNAPSEVAVRVLLLDENRDATAGRALVSVNGAADEYASYEVSGDRYTVRANIDHPRTITFMRIPEGTWIELDGYELQLVG